MENNIIGVQISTEMNEIYSALAKAQEEMQVAHTSSANPFFKSKYAKLDEVIKASRPYLTKNGLSVMQHITYDEPHQFLVTILAHSSGQWVSSRMLLVPVKNEPQSLGSCITYMRRYSYAAVVGVVIGDEDDDGETAQGRGKNLCISEMQVNKLYKILENYQDITTILLKKYSLKYLNDLPADKFDQVLKDIAREINYLNSDQ
jgi:hypothetical protein